MSTVFEASYTELKKLEAEIAKLRAALRDAHKLIDNDLVGPWIMAHKLDDVLGNEQSMMPPKKRELSD